MVGNRRIAKRVVFTDGVFDMLHANHVCFLEEAKSLGDWLVVGVVSDSRAQEYKRRPVLSQEERLRVVEALSCVDEAFIIHEALISETMKRIIAAYHVSAVVYAGDSTPEFYIPAEMSGIMHRLPYRAGVSSSEIIKRIVGRKNLDD
jgi:D-beta-D-heptose 7-phosphate kinase/D-beta-D-heptose 1-phosphate adenosyltransferase